MRLLSVRWWIATLIAVVACGCLAPYSARPRALLVTSGSADLGTWIEGLSSCHPEDGDVVRIDPHLPLTLFVPGSNFSTGGFQTLAQVFEAHGQQTLCFHYDDRERLDVASARLIRALEALERHLPGGKITILGHSQGGLVSRRALVRDRARPLRVGSDFQIRLVTVSSPFRGIAAAKHCGLGWLEVLSFGVSRVVCQGIAGSKWRDIFPGSRFMRHPGTLAPFVTDHIMIVTDERGSCRRFTRNGRCDEQDYTFGVDEQYSKVVDRDRRVAGIEVKAGHIEIVGEEGTLPTKLITILQGHEILARTPRKHPIEIARLIELLY